MLSQKGCMKRPLYTESPIMLGKFSPFIVLMHSHSFLNCAIASTWGFLRALIIGSKVWSEPCCRLDSVNPIILLKLFIALDWFDCRRNVVEVVDLLSAQSFYRPHNNQSFAFALLNIQHHRTLWHTVEGYAWSSHFRIRTVITVCIVKVLYIFFRKLITISI